MVPLLLAMTGGNADIEKQLAELSNFINSTQAAVQSLRSGMETFHAGLNKISRPMNYSPVKEDSDETANSHNSQEEFPQESNFSGPNEKISFTGSADS
jgi:hypothetical protein